MDISTAASSDFFSDRNSFARRNDGKIMREEIIVFMNFIAA